MNNPFKQNPQYPNRLPQESIDDYKPAPCHLCGNVRKATIRWIEHRTHRFKDDKTVTVARESWVCLGCNVQLTISGAPVEEGQDGWLPGDEIKKLLRFA